MLSLQKFFGRDPQFFELLETLADMSRKGGIALKTVLAEPTSATSLHELREARARSKEAHEKLGELIVRTFVTAIEREDLEALSAALYKILKPMEKFAERLQIANGIVQGIDFTAQASVILTSTETVCEMVHEVRKSSNLEHTRKLNARLHHAESQADTLELDLLRDLYKNCRHDPLRIMLIKDLYDLLEKSVDRCRDVGNVVMNIVLKNS